MKNTVFYLLLVLFFLSSCGENGTNENDNEISPDLDNESDSLYDTETADNITEITDSDSDAQNAPVYELLDAAAAYTLVNERKEDPSFHIIDVRSSSEFSTGHIENAENYNVYDVSFSDNIGKLKKDDAFFVYCASGSRSKGAISTMKELGFIELYELSGGLSSWKNAGYPTETE